MSSLLDTNVCIAYLTGRDARVRDRLLALAPEDVLLCSVVKAELLYGARKSQHVEANLRKLDAFFARFVSRSFDDDAAAHYGVVRAQLEREGRRIGANDLLIASIALAVDAAIVTRDQDEFRRVAGLRVEVW